MSKTQEIAGQLGVKILKRLNGSAVLDIDQNDLPEGVYLVEDAEGEKSILKTGGFNKNEIDDNWRLAEIGVATRTITEAVPGEYILYEYVDAPVLATLDFWSEEKMDKVFALHHRIETELNKEPVTEEEIDTLISWVSERPYKVWLDETTDNPWGEEEVAEFRKIIDDHRELWSTPSNAERASYDTHAENYLWNHGELVVMDADITTIPKHYTDMRYLAWVILKMPPEEVSIEWIQSWVERLGKDRARLFTFFISMLGIMWDMKGNKQFKGERKHVNKVEVVKETIYWLVDQLKINN